MHWVGTWTTTPAPVEGIALGNQTLRMIAHVCLGGSTVRVRLSNTCGSRKLGIGAASVEGRPLTFNGSPSIAIPAGALVVSDPVDVEVAPLSDVAVSVYLPGEVPASQVTGHGNAHQTNYISPPGDFTRVGTMPVKETTEAFLFVSAVDVLAPDETGGIVALGDSLTDANISELDANHRWPDQLARRIVGRKDGRMLGVMNQGIGGNRILHDGRGDSGVRRFDRDVLAQPGVTHVIVILGINDIRNRSQNPEEVVTADQMIAGLHQMTVRAHTNGLKIFGGTLLTFEKETFNPGFWTPEGESKRQAVNDWIRKSGAFDAVIDFEAALRNPGHPTQMLPEYDCGDHLHPSDTGYLRMGDIIDLSLFD